MAIKEYSAIPQSSNVTEASSSDCLGFISRTFGGGVLPHCKEAVDVFCCRCILQPQPTWLNTHWGSLTPLLICTRCILQLQLTGLIREVIMCLPRTYLFGFLLLLRFVFFHPTQVQFRFNYHKPIVSLSHRLFTNKASAILNRCSKFVNLSQIRLNRVLNLYLMVFIYIIIIMSCW